MIHSVIPPAPHLKTFVKDYLLLHFVFDNNAPPPVKPFPANTQHSLVFYLRGGIKAFDPKTGTSKTFAKTAINGSQVSRFDFYLSPHYLMFAVNFQPGTLAKFLRLPLTEFIDERIDAEAILPKINQLHERMANSDSYEGIVQIVEEYIWQRICNLKADFYPIDKVMRVITEKPGDFEIKRMAGLSCLSVSQFERRFMQQTGITPKLYARINRFYHAYQIKDREPESNWLSVAIQAGYHDYQHLVKDFRQFANTLPQALIEAQAAAPERLLGIG
ncbi:helix-turn-helix domain-containing protein [Mucilaginibacter flavidus]|uniref:helix-turn-helix domain-containing protein n=1 Tax=Mucilaginibacter flavidus TaxID=2949309 RepID=UPI0020929C49|nr:AraC family transcriptional regulator [Mucilaginibacter flavidus]MCO5949879.1 AraC family transcriptional regulator [Mucilaginibacter flavidus]